MRAWSALGSACVFVDVASDGTSLVAHTMQYKQVGGLYPAKV